MKTTIRQIRPRPIVVFAWVTVWEKNLYVSSGVKFTTTQWARVSGCWRPGIVPDPGLASVRSPEPVLRQPGPGEHSAWQLRDRGNVTRDICQCSVCVSHESDGVSGEKWWQKCESDESRVSSRRNVILDTGNIKQENDKTNFNFVFVSPNYKN